GKSDHVEVAALYPLHPTRGDTLNRVGSGFVHRLLRPNVECDLILGQRTEHDLRYLSLGAFECWSHEAHSRDDLMASSGEQPQHACRVLLAGRFLQQMLVNYDHGVSAQHGVVWMARKNCASFVASQALRVIDRIFVWEGLFRDVRRFNGECDSSIAQKLRPAWRSRGKDQRHGGPIVRINVRSPLGAKETSEME